MAGETTRPEPFSESLAGLTRQAIGCNAPATVSESSRATVGSTDGPSSVGSLAKKDLLTFLSNYPRSHPRWI
jgi:hypothetical protein